MSIPTRKLERREGINFSQGAFVYIGSGKEAVVTSGKALKEYRAIAARDAYSGYEGNISVRDQFSRQNYESFRPGEAMPQKPHDIIAACRAAYRKVGLIRNVIDLMADFGVQGIKITHPNARINKFFRGWAKKVGVPRVSERFLNLYYREGIAVIKRTMGKITVREEDEMRANAGLGKVPEIDEPLEPDIEKDKGLSTKKRNIPLRYNFLNPLSLNALGGELASFVGQTFYSIKISQKLRNMVVRPANTIEKQLVTQLPPEIRTAVERGDTEILLDPRKVRTFSYKKDDWQTWADPMLYAVLSDVALLEKMKLADLAALDGAISQVRIWKLGDLEKGIVPTEAAVQRLADILLSNPGGGAFDIIWGPELSVEEYKTNVHQFLGKAKYEPVLEGIYAGLGIPPTLTGSATQSGFTNNFISLKTLVQRLEYGRAALREFWEQEIELVRQAMGFQRPARVEFDNMILTDEVAARTLLIQLADRDYLSVDTLIERFGECPEFEDLKLRQERRARDAGTMSPKASPYHSPQQAFELLKVALQAGLIGPKTAGIETPTLDQEEEPPFLTKLKSQEKVATMRGAAGPKPATKIRGTGGRPKNSKDTTKRKPKSVKPVGAMVESTAAFLTTLMWAKDAQQTIANIATPAILHVFKKPNMRALSDEQAAQAEAVKFALLCSVQPYHSISTDDIHTVLASSPKVPKEHTQLYNALCKKLRATSGKELSMDDCRSLQATTYALLNTSEELLCNQNAIPL